MSETYNGWKNWATWNIALWIDNDPDLYEFSRKFVNYKDLAQALVDCDTPTTPDGASYTDPDLDTYALDEWLTDEC